MEVDEEPVDEQPEQEQEAEEEAEEEADKGVEDEEADNPYARMVKSLAQRDSSKRKVKLMENSLAHFVFGNSDSEDDEDYNVGDEKMEDDDDDDSNDDADPNDDDGDGSSGEVISRQLQHFRSYFHCRTIL